MHRCFPEQSLPFSNYAQFDKITLVIVQGKADTESYVFEWIEHWT